ATVAPRRAAAHAASAPAWPPPITMMSKSLRFTQVQPFVSEIFVGSALADENPQDIRPIGLRETPSAKAEPTHAFHSFLTIGHPHPADDAPARRRTQARN